MNERIQKVLDGELDREALGPAETAELDAYEAAMDRALAPLRSEAAPDVTAAVTRRIATLPVPGAALAEPGALARLAGWLWSPRPVSFRLRPAWGVAVAGLAAVALLVGPGGDVAPDPAAVPAVAEAEAPRVYVHFRLDLADARSVALAGDFTGWQPSHALHETSPGVWTAVVPVQAGVHQYAFVVDGERWVVDPAAPLVDDGFGGSNSRLDLVTPAERAEL